MSGVEQALMHAEQQMPGGKWGVAVSGGADSVALLLLLHQRNDLSLHVIHLDHQTRDGESAADARFVSALAARLGLPCTCAIRSEVEAGMTELPRNISARFRAARLELFRRAVAEHNLSGVAVAHHADDQAETIFLRLLRGSSAEGLAGMAWQTRIGGITIVRPLLEIAAVDLRQWLRSRGENWREDSSNSSGKYRRNGVRKLLRERKNLRDELLALGESCRELNLWTGKNAPLLPEQFAYKMLADLPVPLARRAAMVWLCQRGVPRGRVDGQIKDQLIAMASDAASPARREFPGKIMVRRRQGMIFSELRNAGWSP